MKRILAAGLLVAAFATPALAEYFVAQNNSTHKCSVVSQKPDGYKLTQLGPDSFKTKSEAHQAMVGMSECKV